MSQHRAVAPAEGTAAAAHPARGRLLGGVSAELAARTGAPVTAIRLGWVAAVLLVAAVEPLVAWIVIAAYGVAWWSASRARSDPRLGWSPAPAPVTQQPPAPAAPQQPSARIQPGAGSARQPDPRLAEFVRYLWSSATTPTPVYKFSAHGFVRSDLQLSKDQMTVQWRLARTPYGRIVVWPGWMVFMTESHNRPGELPPASRFWSVLLDFVREYRRYTTLLSLARTSYGLLTQEQRDRFRGMLANPNTIVVPLHAVRSCHQERSLGNPRLVIRTDDREIMFGPNGALEVFTSFWRMAAGMVGAWHPRFQKLVADAIAASQQRPQQP